MKFVLLSGSFRKQSRSLALLRIADNLLINHQCNVPLLDALPFYSEDTEPNKPQVVIDFLNDVNSADGIIICTPEYNHSIPAVLKNALDWASRPAFASPMRDKPVTIITQADSPVGGARVQAHLKLVLDAMLASLYPNHEMMIPNISSTLADGSIIIEKTQNRLMKHLDGFTSWIDNQPNQN